ncbi:MAG: TetR/AcrR family transcriptional regulator [Gemmatimonadetes bacterium]|nr:TetR/AcrR family transcriptional regulator [Gemmatimonadota bacterium]
MSIHRDQIIRCACDLYLSDGIEGFSMRKLAKCVGCTAPALYRHYESKDEVIQDVVTEAYRQFTQYLYRALEGRTPSERFTMAGKSYFDFAMEQPALYEIIYLPRAILGAHSADVAVAHEASAIGQFWTDRVREMMDAGFLKDGDPSEVSHTLWGHAHGLISIYHRGLLSVQSPAEFRVLMTESFFRLMKGLGTEAFDEVVESIRKVRNMEPFTA